jgi:hypothetical protein
MHMIWHYDGCVEVAALAVGMQGLLQDGMAGFRSKWDSIGFAEGHE